MCCVVWIAYPDKMLFNYSANALTAAAVRMNKKSLSPGPFANPVTQMACCPCTGVCTWCLLYRELNEWRDRNSRKPEQQRIVRDDGEEDEKRGGERVPGLVGLRV